MYINLQIYAKYKFPLSENINFKWSGLVGAIKYV